MPLFSLTNIPEFEISKGIHARAIHAENVTILHVNIDQGALLPEHAHFHEQILNVIDGELELTVAGETYRLSPGQVVVIPSNAIHSGKAVTDLRLVDVFHPVREDFRGSNFAGYPSDQNR
jgi:quercetin dioxygenase-like cupin family protein